MMLQMRSNSGEPILSVDSGSALAWQGSGAAKEVGIYDRGELSARKYAPAESSGGDTNCLLPSYGWVVELRS